MTQVNISIPQEFYSRFESLPNTAAHTLAEFIDNAIQSFENTQKEIQILEHNLQCEVSIDFEFDENDIAQTIIVRDNAGGISDERIQTALQPSNRASDITGLNEFGVGLKTAALWLGHKFELRTKCLNETHEKRIVFDADEVIKNNLHYLPQQLIEKDPEEHYTQIIISKPATHTIKKSNISRIHSELASIYRTKFRKGSLKLIVAGEVVEFEEFSVLNAPYVDDKEGPSISWKVYFDCAMPDGIHKARGFFALLEPTNQLKNRLVLIRRDRVISGVNDNQRYHFQCISEQKGSPIDKRLYGEVEIEGFDVYFNKNDISDKDELEALMVMIRDYVAKKYPKFFKQAKRYRSKTQNAAVNVINKEKKKAKTSVVKPAQLPKIEPAETEFIEKANESLKSIEENRSVGESVTDESACYTYIVDGQEIEMTMKIEENDDLRLYRISTTGENKITCYVNFSNPFIKKILKKVSKSDDVYMPMIRSLAIAEYAQYRKGNTDAYNVVANLIEIFNQYLGSENV